MRLNRKTVYYHRLLRPVWIVDVNIRSYKWTVRVFVFMNTDSCNLFNSNPSIPAEPWITKIQREPKVVAKKNGCQMAHGVDFLVNLRPSWGPTGSREPVHSSEQVFAQAGNGVDFCFLHFFLWRLVRFSLKDGSYWPGSYCSESYCRQPRQEVSSTQERWQHVSTRAAEYVGFNSQWDEEKFAEVSQ